MFDPRYRSATWISVIISIIFQLDGVNVLNFYSSVIFSTVLSKGNAAIGSVLVGVAQILGVMLAPAIGSRVGMKKIFVIG